MFSFCADDKLCEDLAASGHIDLHVREAIRLGLKPITAYKMATLNAARYYRLDHLVGSVTPGKLADLLILDTLEDASPSLVMVNGAVAARHNNACFPNDDAVPSSLLDTVHIHPRLLTAESFRVSPKVDGSRTGEPAQPLLCWVQAVEMYDGYFKRAFHASLRISTDSEGESFVLCDTGPRDIVKIAILDRHHATENRGIAFVRGFGLKRGAFATTTNCENQNLVVVGADDESMAAAATEIAKLGGSGGMLAVDGSDQHRLLGCLKLDVAGCMSPAPWEEVRDLSLDLDRLVREKLGVTMKENPFLIASFVGLVAVPDLGLTELGLVVDAGKSLMDPVLQVEHSVEADSDSPVRICCRCARS